LYGRDEEKPYVHGSSVSRMLRELEAGIPACVTVTLVDGLVAVRLRSFHELPFRRCIWNGAEDRAHHRSARYAQQV